MSERKVLRDRNKRYYKSVTAWNMRKEGKSLKQIADFLEVDKDKVYGYIKEYERLYGET